MVGIVRVPHSRAFMTTSIKVKHENEVVTARRLMRRPDTNWATHSLSGAKQLKANLSNIRNLAWYLATDIPSFYLRDKNIIFYFALMLAGK